MRESPSVTVMERLRDGGAHVDYSDPYWKTFPKMRQHRFDLASVAVTPDTLASYDAVVLITDHSAFDYEMIQEHAPLLIDTRGKFRHAAHVIRARSHDSYRSGRLRPLGSQSHANLRLARRARSGRR